jgi:hypothetical protein
MLATLTAGAIALGLLYGTAFVFAGDWRCALAAAAAFAAAAVMMLVEEDGGDETERPSQGVNQ